MDAGHRIHAEATREEGALWRRCRCGTTARWAATGRKPPPLTRRRGRRASQDSGKRRHDPHRIPGRRADHQTPDRHANRKSGVDFAIDKAVELWPQQGTGETFTGNGLNNVEWGIRNLNGLGVGTGPLGKAGKWGIQAQPAGESGRPR